MKIELKNVKYAAFASQETSCFEATVYVDGKKAGTADNNGRGGPTTVRPWPLAERINAYAATLPGTVTEYKNSDGSVFVMKQTAETIIDRLLSDFLIARDVKRTLKTCVVYISAKDGTVRNSTKITPDQLARGLRDEEMLKTRLNATRILNTRPVAEIVALLRAEAA
jgi:hypothetical protein